MEIKRVLQRGDLTKYIIIPRKSKIKIGDYVKIVKIEAQKDSEVAS